MTTPGFNDFLKTTPKFDNDKNGQISTSNMNVSYLYKQYIRWLIKQQIKEKIPALDLLAQIHIINQFILNDTCSRVNDIYRVNAIEDSTLNSYIKNFNSDKSASINKILRAYVKTRDSVLRQQESHFAFTFTQIGACSQVCLVVGAGLIGAYLAADLAVPVIYSLGALGVVFIGASLIFLRKAMNYDDDLANLRTEYKKTLDDAASSIALNISSESRKPFLISEIKATLLATSSRLIQTNTEQESRNEVDLMRI